MRLTPPPPPLCSSSTFLRSLFLALSVFSCSFNTVIAASIPSTVALPHTTHLNVRAGPPAVELKLALHFPPWPLEIQSGVAHMSIGGNPIAQDHNGVPTDPNNIENDPYRLELGNILFDGATTPDFPKEILEQIETAARELQQTARDSEHSHKRLEYLDTLEEQLDFHDIFMNRLLSGEYQGWKVPTDVLESYQKRTSACRKTIKPEKKSEYLDVFLNVHPETARAQAQISSNVDMRIGNQIIAYPTRSHPGGSHPSETSQTAEIQLCNTPGVGTKLIGFILVYGNPGVINTAAEQTSTGLYSSKRQRSIVQRAQFLSDFWDKMVQGLLRTVCSNRGDRGASAK
ncbi:hypothetical protein F5880DRAFT_1614666 [Lentinula raphanica]|nr:hypothetical protein F5880DRAFT_1614666 [Lentinula raphanica]